MEMASMAEPDSVPCPLCGEPVARPAKRCENCGAVLPEKEVEELRAFMEALKVDPDTAAKLYASGYRPEEPVAETRAPEGGTPYLCPACGAFVNSTDAQCEHCGMDLALETERDVGALREIPDLCPECGSLAPTGRQTCAVCGTSLRPGVPAAKPWPAPAGPPPIPPPEITARPVAPEASPRPAPRTVKPKPGTRRATRQARDTGPAARPRRTALSTPTVVQTVKGRPPAPDRSAVEESPPPFPGVQPRFDRLREVAAIGTLVALPVAAAASLAGVAGLEYGQLFLFGVLFGLGATLTAPELRVRGTRRFLILLFLAGTLLLAATPVLGYGGVASAGGEILLLAAGTGFLVLLAWRLRDGVGPYLPWLAGLLLLTILAIGPLALVPPGPTTGQQWAVGGALSVGAAAWVALRRYLRGAVDARIAKADSEYARREYEKAIATYDAGLAIARRAGVESSAAWYGKGAALVAAGKPEEAIHTLDRALALNPGNEIAWINKGTALSRLGRLQEALRCYNSAIKVNPRYEVAWNNKGNALARLGRHDLALACYEQALVIDRAYRTAWVNKGFVLAKLGRFEEAAECADAALRLTTGGGVAASA